MHMEIVDLYQRCGQPRNGAAGGSLTCLYAQDPIGSGRRHPGVLILPGGGYGSTSLREAEPVAMHFLARGYHAFILHYSCVPSRYPTALREAAMAMRCIREQENTGPVAAVGFSAGGHLCGCLGTLFDSPETADIAPPETVRPDALGLCYPVTVSHGKPHADSFENLTGGDSGVTEALSLEKLVRCDMPPAYLWHTRDDGTVPVWGTLVLAKAMEEAGADFALRIYRHGQHGLSTGDGLVYPVGQVPDASKNLKNWPEECMDFLEAIGFSITEEPKHE